MSLPVLSEKESLEILQEILEFPENKTTFIKTMYNKPTPVGIWIQDLSSDPISWNKNMFVITETLPKENINTEIHFKLIYDFENIQYTKENKIYGCSIPKHDVVGHKFRNYINKMYMGLQTLEYGDSEKTLEILFEKTEEIVEYLN